MIMSKTSIKEKVKALLSRSNKKSTFYSEQDLAYMQSLSAAVLEQKPKHIRPVLLLWLISICLFIIWASIAEIDEISRGIGEIVPSGENKIIQNLEGGIVQEVLVSRGDIVIIGQPLLKLHNQKSASLLESNTIKAMELQAKLIRLKAEATATNFIMPRQVTKELLPLIEREKSLYITNQAKLQNQQQALEQQLAQRKLELAEANVRLKHLGISRLLIAEEVNMTEPVVRRGIKPKVDFIKLQREANTIEENYQSSKIAIDRLTAAITEANNNLLSLQHQHQSDAKKEMNEVITELKQLETNNKTLTDQTTRTLVRSPSNGIIQNIFIHTLGGVVKPGENLIELVPTDDILWVETKLKPSDIAFIYPGQKAMVKFSAYDFSIYGGLEGEVVKISADTQTDRQDNTFYTVHIKTQNNFRNIDTKHQLKILPGMTTNVDIITGKKTILSYILKPILRANYYTFSER